MSTTAAIEQDSLQSRLSDPVELFPDLGEVSGGIYKAVWNGAVSRTTIGLVQLRVGQIVGSTYHTIRHSRLLRKAGETEERITAVASWQDAPYFTEAERTALELVQAVFTPNPFRERVSDELFAKAAAHYDDKALWTLTLAIGQICLFVPVALIGRPIPGKDYRTHAERPASEAGEMPLHGQKTRSTHESAH